jgi:hypothetical protein
MVVVEPARFALTSTPSIAPSSCELTSPANADANDVCALTGPASSKVAESAPIRAGKRASGIFPIMLNPPLPFGVSNERGVSNRLGLLVAHGKADRART